MLKQFNINIFLKDDKNPATVQPTRTQEQDDDDDEVGRRKKYGKNPNSFHSTYNYITSVYKKFTTGLLEIEVRNRMESFH